MTTVVIVLLVLAFGFSALAVWVLCELLRGVRIHIAPTLDDVDLEDKQ